MDGVRKGQVVDLKQLVSLSILGNGDFWNRAADCVERVESDHLVPLRRVTVQDVKAQPLCNGASHPVLALHHLGGRVRLARETTCVGVPGLCDWVPAILLIAHELGDGDGVGDL